MITDSRTAATSDNLHSFPSIPLDVARLIIEIAAEDDKQSALQLSFVSKEVQEWVDHFLFGDDVLIGLHRAEISQMSHRMDAFLKFCQSETERTRRIKRCFRRFTSDYSHCGVLIVPLLTECHNLTHLFIGGLQDLEEVEFQTKKTQRQSILDIPVHTRIKHCYLGFTPNSIFSPLVEKLPSITHLGFWWPHFGFPSLSSLSNLTHLWLIPRGRELILNPPAFTQKFFSWIPPSIKVIILFYPSGWDGLDGSLPSGRMDDRIVLLEYSRRCQSPRIQLGLQNDVVLPQYEERWGYDYTLGIGQAEKVWEIAERVVEERASMRMEEGT